MTCVLTVASQKGGVGKTTTAVNLSASLALAGKRILLVDFDPQGNASSGVGFSRLTPGHSRSRDGSTRGYLSQAISGKSISPLLRTTRFENLSVLASCPDLSVLEVIQRAQGKGLEEFRRQVELVGQGFELVVIDCPPSLGGLPTIALGVSHRVLIPVQCEYYAMEGLSQILPIIQKVRSTTNADLQIGGLLLTMFSEGLELSMEVVEEVREYFKDSVFRTVIPRDVVLAEAASHGLPAFHYAPTSRGAWSYLELAKEVLEHDWT